MSDIIVSLDSIDVRTVLVDEQWSETQTSGRLAVRGPEPKDVLEHTDAVLRRTRRAEG